jgi:putative transposase
LDKSIGCARFAYNWGLNLSIEKYKKDEKYLGAIGLHKELCAVKESEFPWMYEVSKLAPQNALRDLDTSFKSFFNGIKKKQNIGFPKFKSKRDSIQTFRIDGANIKIQSHCIKLPNISSIRLKEHDYIPLENVKYLNATISKEIDRYYVSVAVSYESDIEPKQIEDVIGIDLGIKELATCSNGYVYNNPKNTKKYSKKLSKEQRRLSRKVKGSNNRKKQIVKVAKVHRKIKNSRIDNLHKMTTEITKAKCSVIVLEDLNVKGMMKNHKLSKVVADSSFFEIKRQFTYKTLFYGGEVFEIDGRKFGTNVWGFWKLRTFKTEVLKKLKGNKT